MDTFNWIVFLWQVSFGVSIITLLIGLVKRSWVSMLISSVTFLPVAYYFLGAENGLRLIGFIPILLLILTIVFWRSKKRA
ncbi:hypothetical protein KGR20_06880 [Cytobacillus oceanisediminis]|uniref:NADH dehydrogenase subunit 4L n=1 Tax=Niallia alba TaxID=2729105 RepID=A0A7Y0KC72_9BACI|nr:MULTISPECIES: hypothetical protein [Bacillaceae]MBQ6446861.1 hypothetical protein [Bacillus sp. (in: firmicutes)]MBZ9533985.1 hypothetical protein [Cytobacillus oceanisediminis]NMO78939.1 hypothetical protein [Niallia alba]NMO79955.1 hypothetical protein [Niallia alba]UTI42271.1 hypothetical protein NKG37_00445 [Niallia sp. RD1]